MSYTAETINLYASRPVAYDRALPASWVNCHKSENRLGGSGWPTRRQSRTLESVQSLVHVIMTRSKVGLMNLNHRGFYRPGRRTERERLKIYATQRVRGKVEQWCWHRWSDAADELAWPPSQFRGTLIRHGLIFAVPFTTSLRVVQSIVWTPAHYVYPMRENWIVVTKFMYLNNEHVYVCKQLSKPGVVNCFN